jgi:hypothetical protein
VSPLPTFVVLGAMRAGTTSIYDAFRQHPEVFVSPEKETDYFSLGDLCDRELTSERHRHSATNRTEYEALFRGAGAARAVGEASPSYLYHFERSARRLRELLPEAKLICILRDPVDRAYSHFGLNRKLGFEPLADLEAAIAAAAERSGPRRPPSRFAYVEAGRYAAALAEFAAGFPPEQLRVVLFEELRRDPAATMRRLYEHVGVDADFAPDLSVRHNRSGEPRASLLASLVRRTPWLSRFLLRRLSAAAGSRLADLLLRPQPRLAAEVRRRLRPRFAEDVSRLQSLLGRDLSGWLADD